MAVTRAEIEARERYVCPLCERHDMTDYKLNARDGDIYKHHFQGVYTRAAGGRGVGGPVGHVDEVSSLPCVPHGCP